MNKFISFFINILLIAIAILSCNTASAHYQIILNDDIDKYEIGKHIKYLQDDENKLTIDDIVQKEGQFIESTEIIPNFGYTTSSYWIKIDYEYQTDLVLDHKRYAIEIFYPLLDNIEVYHRDRFGTYQVSRRGDTQPFYYRTPLYRNYIIKFDAKPNQAETVYIKLQTRGAMRASLRILSDDHLLEHVSHIELLYGLGFGMLLMMVVYNLFLFFSLRESVYLNYVCYTLAFLILQLSLTGYAYEYLWPSSVWLANYATSIWGSIFIFMSLMFMRSILQININMPKFDKVLKVILSAVAVGVVLCFVVDYGITIRVLSAMGGIVATLLITVGIIGLKYKIRAARYYVLGSGVLWLGILVYLLMAKGYIPNNFWTENGILLTAIFELLIFSFALADRINHERQQKEQIQKESLEYLNGYVSVFENAEEGLFRLSLKGKFTNINRSLVKILGRENKEEIINCSVNPLRYYCTNLSDVKHFIKILRQNDKVIAFELEFKKANGEGNGWVSCSARLVRDEDNIPLYYEGSVLDITAKKDKESTEKKMEEVKANAEAKGVFLANMSHEIRTPMNSVLSFVELAQRLPDQSSRMVDYLGKIKLSSQSLLRIINDILDLSKIEAGKFKLERINFDISSVASNLREIFTDQAENKGLKFEINVAEDVPHKLVGDPVRLNQVLINLISNAIKFTDKGKVTVDITHSFTSDQFVSLKFEVTDTGAGIKEELLPTMFTPFNQLDDSVSRKYGGTGLGLSICSHLVSLMRGKIFVESQVEEGSKFTFTASFKSNSVKPEQEPNSQQINPTKLIRSSSKTGFKSSLIVEDNPMNREVLKELLSEFDVNVDVAENGQEAVDSVKSKAYDLVLMDIQMPVMNGYEAAEIIRDLGHEMPIIAITANALKGVKDKCLQSGMNDFMTKPIDVNAFFNKITYWLGDAGESKVSLTGHKIPERQQKTDEQEVKEAMTKAAEVSLIAIDGLEEIDFSDSIFAPETKAIIDKEMALAGLNGKEELFIKLLIDFKKTESLSFEAISNDISCDNFEKARSRVHTIKGLAGSFGCDALQKICFIIQNELDNNRMEHMHILLKRYQELLLQFLDSANYIIENSEKPKPKKIDQQPNGADALEKLSTYLDENNQLARGIIESMLKNETDKEKLQKLEQMVQAISGFDFSKAREIFKSFK